MSFEDEISSVLEKVRAKITNPSLNERQKWLLASDEVRMMGMVAGTHGLSVMETFKLIEAYEANHPDITMEEPHPKRDLAETIFWEYMNEYEHYDELKRGEKK